MPTALPSTLRSDRVLVAALSGRALALAARRAGAVPVVLDLYGDEDTAEAAAACLKLRPGRYGFDGALLLEAVALFAAERRGLVYGAGFEGDIELLRGIAALTPLIGNPPAVVAEIKDPLGFAALLRRLGVPHPEITLAPPRGGGWLSKQAGGSGGSHILPAETATAASRTYFQRQVPGHPLSVLFVADGTHARIIGYSEQWTDPSPGHPFRYGGCVGPVRPAPPLRNTLEEVCEAITGAARLVGLNSLDLLVEGANFQVLEVNPRPGATLDILDHGELPLWHCHRLGVEGRLPPTRPLPREARAASILYAPCPIVIPPGFAWPAWAADRSPGGTVIAASDPLCTIHATAGNASAARLAAARQARHLLDQLIAMQAREGKRGDRVLAVH